MYVRIFTRQVLNIFLVSIMLLLCMSCRLMNFGIDPDPEPKPDPDPNPVEEQLKILFIGASYISANNLPLILKNLSETAGKSVSINVCAPGGRMLPFHAQSSGTTHIIESEKWDYVLLQGVCVNAGYPETHQGIFPPYVAHPLLPALKSLYSTINANHKDTHMVYMMPWAFEDGSLWVQGGTDTYSDMQRKVYDNTLKFAEEVNMGIAPVGWAWYQILKDAKPPYEHYLHSRDFNHPSYRGSYLTACVLFASIFNESASGVNYYGKLSASEAGKFQKIASDVVLDDWGKWKLE
ncbi:hypothetical protein KAR48_14595 [bacterium]|nr:hypothetical protein [bacterium]